MISLSLSSLGSARRPAGFTSCATQLWSATCTLLCDEHQKVARAAAECLGALGAAIFAEGGVAASGDKTQRARLGAPGRGRQRGSGRGSVPDSSPQKLSPLVLLEWAMPLLVGSADNTGKAAIPCFAVLFMLLL